MKKAKRTKTLQMIALTFCLLAGSMPATALAAEPSSITAVIEKTTPSVVAIIGKPTTEHKALENNRFNLAHGTGVIVRNNGYILTNAHVVKDMRSIVVVTADGKSYSGKTTHYDEASDLALVKIEATNLPAATFASSSDIHVGDSVMAIGTPLSFALRNSVSSGIISGLDRNVESQYQLIQTDAAINPGNSGGALVNMKGQVVGINTMKYVSFGIDSLGFAIPVDTVQYVLDQFFKYGKVKRPYLGLELEESWEAVVGLPSQEGLKVSYVEPDSPAAKAGVQKDDILISVGGSKVKSLVQFNEVLKKYLPEQKVALVLQNASGTKTLDAVLGEDTSSVTELKQDQDGSYIDSDQGKTKIGDSHFGWSMDYPTGLIKADQSESGNSIGFADSKGDFGIYINIEEKASEDLSPYGLIQKVSKSSYDTVLEKQYVDHPEQPYAKLVGKSAGDSYFQVRAYHKGDKIYYVTMYIRDEELFQNNMKQNRYNELLDSFRLSFDAQDSSLKDISIFQDKTTVTSEYGISFDIPAEWDTDRFSSRADYRSQDGKKSVSLTVTSASSGDTLKDWATRQESKVTESYAEGFREISGLKETTVDGVPALENRYSTTMGEKWESRHSVYFIKDKYKYRFDFTFPKESEAEEIDKLISDLTGSVSFDKEALNKSLGFIQDEEDLINKDKTYKYSNKTYKYEASVPEVWTSSGSSYDYEDYDYDYSYGYGYGGTTDSKLKTFSFLGGHVTVWADETKSLEDELKDTAKGYKENSENDEEYKYTETDEEYFGGDVKKYEVSYKTRGIGYSETEYIFRRNDITYNVKVRINDAVKTEENVKRLGEFLQSLKFEAQ